MARQKIDKLFLDKIDTALQDLNKNPGVTVIKLNPEDYHIVHAWRDALPGKYLLITGKNAWVLDVRETLENVWDFWRTLGYDQVTSMKKLKSLGWHAGIIVWFKSHWQQDESVRLVEDMHREATPENSRKFSWEYLLEGKE